MKYGSICSGIEAASVAFQPLDWEPAWFSEIEAFPNAVLAHHYPGVQNHGDMSNLADKILAGEIEAPDMICGGPPCQAFSVAGSRQSLSDKRGNLTLEYIRICDANDAVRSADGREATWILYENVPGLLSVSDNAFGAFLGGLVGRTAPIPEPEGGWTGAGVVDGPTRCAAWRVLDAQHFGLAQRRKRVFVLARGGAGRWAVADALLPIIESGRWHPAPSRPSREGVAPTISARTSGGGGLGTDFDLDGGLTVFDPAQITSVANRSNPQPGDPCHTLHQSEPPMLIRMREGKEGGGKGPLVSEDQSLTLATGNDQVLCASATYHTFEHKGIEHASLPEADPREVLRILREEVGEEAFVEWGFGVIASLQQEEVLRAWLYGSCLRCETPARWDTSRLVQVSFKEGYSVRAMRELWDQGPDGRTPQGRRLVEQLCDELEATVPKLSHAGTLSEEAMHDMRKAAEGIGVLRQALSEVQKAGRSEQDGVFREKSLLGSGVRSSYPCTRNVQQARTAEEKGNAWPATENEVGMRDGQVEQRLVVRRLVPEETEALQGFPRGYTRIPWKGKSPEQCPDGPRYRAIGNSWAVPCARWIGERIKAIRP